MNGMARKASLRIPVGICAGGDGVVHTWDMRMRRCLERAVDEGNFASTSLAVSADGRLYATGSKAGVVNLYDRTRRCQALVLFWHDSPCLCITSLKAFALSCAVLF